MPRYELIALPNHSRILDTECTLAGPNRTLRVLARRAAPDGDEATVIGICEDITKGKAWEEQNVERVRLADFCSAVGAALTETGTLEAALAQCANAMIEHLDVSVSRIWTTSNDGTTLELKASAGLRGDLERPPRGIPIEHFTNGLLGHQTIDGARLSDQEWVEREGLHGFGGYPLLVDDRLVGVMTMFSRKSLSHSTIATLAIVAKQLALGIEHKKRTSS